MESVKRLFSYFWVKLLLVGSVITLLAGYAYQLSTFYVVENNLTDRVVQSEREVDNRIIMIGIDEKSLTALGKWPWPRAYHAEIMRKVAEGGAKAVWLDAILSEPSHDQDDNAAIAEVAAKYPNVVFSTNYEFPRVQSGKGKLEYDRVNMPFFPVRPEQLAHVNVLPDRDNKIRTGILSLPHKELGMIPSVGVRLANYLLPEKEKIRQEKDGTWYRGSEKIPVNDRQEVYFSFAQRPGSETGFDVLSYEDVISGTVPPETFKNAVVLIGPYATGMQDQYFTPMSKSLSMYGVEIHANFIQSLLDNKLYSPLSKTVGWILIACMAFGTYALTNRFKGIRGLFVFIGLFVLYTLALIITFSYGILLPYVYVLLAIIAAYVYSVVDQYLTERQQRNRVTSLFVRYVSKSIVDDILSKKEEVQLGGVRRDVTLIFVDIRGFTPLSEKLEPEQVVEVLNEYLDLCTRAIFKFNGTLDKFIGDGVMGIFGAPIQTDNHAELAIRAALEMRKGSAELTERLRQQIGHTVQFGIGINSGDAVIGNIGSKSRLDYTAIGDTVNLAARLESNAKPGKILISENTKARVESYFIIEEMGEMKVKGKEHSVMVYEVIGEKLEDKQKEA
ncbi:adenylate cyclase [Aneurinibacillus soli]|uniref:Adenylate cyclase 2 n=1 Tax=Aneurinibacillus soli TaxID=1500254 RepID=A0A0U5BFW6_9BACL|nr:adenylate/guanylate cyclase domain-containing protein [Aneurinibacillus soli]PYE59145.1 adenylate cyclase [Aneurinibacillus soli]BAU29565.1 Adenylate cyclase 2 [Aneurinibacillus soli]